MLAVVCNHENSGFVAFVFFFFLIRRYFVFVCLWIWAPVLLLFLEGVKNGVRIGESYACVAQW